jgi:hypothetical protein
MCYVLAFYLNSILYVVFYNVLTSLILIAVKNKKVKKGGVILHKNYNRVTGSKTNASGKKIPVHDTATESFRLRYCNYVFSLHMLMF